MTREELEKKYQSFSQSELIVQAEAFEDQFRYEGESHPADDPAKMFFWLYGQFPLSFLPDNRWAEWYANEVRMSSVDGRESYYKELELWWLKSPWEEPVFIVFGRDKRWYIWEGNHRIGISAKHKQESVPAFLGICKAPITN